VVVKNITRVSPYRIRTAPKKKDFLEPNMVIAIPPAPRGRISPRLMNGNLKNRTKSLRKPIW
jgi:hypothetical protein